MSGPTDTTDPKAHLILRDEDLPSYEEIAALRYRWEGDAMVGQLGARLDDVNAQLEQSALYGDADPEWLKRCRAYRYAVIRRRAEVRKRLPSLEVVRRTANAPGAPMDHKALPPSSFAILGSAMARQKRLMRLCEALYDAYANAMATDTEEDWEACDKAWGEIHAMVTQ